MNENELLGKKAVYVYGMITRGLIIAIGMQAENEKRKMLNKSPAYVEEHFSEVLDENGINHHDLVISLNQDY